MKGYFPALSHTCANVMQDAPEDRIGAMLHDGDRVGEIVYLALHSFTFEFGDCHVVNILGAIEHMRARNHALRYIYSVNPANRGRNRASQIAGATTIVQDNGIRINKPRYHISRDLFTTPAVALRLGLNGPI